MANLTFLEPVEKYRGYTIKFLVAETSLCNQSPNGRPVRSRPQNKRTIVFPICLVLKSLMVGVRINLPGRFQLKSKELNICDPNKKG